MNKELICRIDERGRATLRLNRQQKHNAFDGHLIDDLARRLQQLENDPRVRLVVLTGAGKHFCAGAELEWLRKLSENSPVQNRSAFMALADLLQALNQFAKPTLALVQGACYGGGVGLVAACDIAIAGEGATFCLSEVKLGLIPATISPYVTAAIGSRAARRHILSAEPFSATEALRTGLVHEVVSDDQLTERGEFLSTALLRNGPQAMSKAKQLLHNVAQRPLDADLIFDTSTWIADLLSEAEAHEGLQAFFNKRPPNWTDE